MDQLSRARTLGAIVERVTAPERSRTMAESPGVRRTGSSKRLGRPVAMALEAVDAPMRSTESPGGLVAGGTGPGHRRRPRGRGRPRRRGCGRTAIGRSGSCTTSSPRGGEGGCVGRRPHLGRRPSPGSLDRVAVRGPAGGDRPRAAAPRAAATPGSTRRLWPSGWAPRSEGSSCWRRPCADDLDEAARQAARAWSRRPAMGGGFASLPRSRPATSSPGHGAIAGLVKTLAREWPEVRARVVDLDPREERRAARRAARRPSSSPTTTGPRSAITVAGGSRSAPWLRSDSTSGGRGVSLRRGRADPDHRRSAGDHRGGRGRPGPALAADPPAGRDEPAARRRRTHRTSRARTSPAELKACLLERLSRQGWPSAPAELERAYQSLRREREIRANLRALRDAGARVEYAQVDVRDADGAGLGARRAGDDEFGPLVGLIHGAGVIQDKLLRDKTPESFDRVLGTKLDGALNLAAAARPRRAPVRGLLLVGRRPVRQPRPVRLRGGQRGARTSWPSGSIAAGRAGSSR